MELQEETIDLREIFFILRKRIVLIVSVTLLAAIVSALLSYFVLTPVYQAETDLLVNKSQQTDKTDISQSDIQANLQLIDTYNVVIKSPRIMNIVASRINEQDVGSLIASVNVSAVKNSQVISITVDNPDKQRAVLIANTVANTFKEEVVKIMKVDNVQILSEAKVDPKAGPVKPKPSLNIAIAIVVGLMVSVGIAFLLEYLDNSIKNEQDVEKYLGMSVLGAVSTIEIDRDQIGRAHV
jgi:capsular polysaccharide biosynthesis protein